LHQLARRERSLSARRHAARHAQVVPRGQGSRSISKAALTAITKLPSYPITDSAFC